MNSEAYDGDAPTVVALIAPIAMHKAESYDAALTLIEERHAGAEILNDRALFENFADWRKNHERVFANVELLYALVSEDGTVGRGNYETYEYITGRGGECVILAPEPEESGMIAASSKGASLEVIDEEDFRHYAAPLWMGEVV